VLIDLTPRQILAAIDEGLHEAALLTALGYEVTQGRPGRHLLNNALERRGYGRPLSEPEPDRLRPYQSYPDDWVQTVAKAVSGRADASLHEVIETLKR
jgi:hypothetical protein